ncbi:MAG TPA: LLM class flavin-dependent oxidoreductase [Acidimicrobiales bacterium]|nr:LLM class flavin-dependent oxidoreductase [Acidimicrobiales bacterium]
MKIRIGVGLTALASVTDGERFGGFVDDLERLGFDSLWLSERATAPSPEPMVGLAFAAGRTRKLKFGTSVQVLPGRNPVLLAKAWATLDRLSNGRALPAFGLGVADPNEQQAFMVERRERAAWFDEALPLIRRMWTEDVVDHSGERFKFEGLRVNPKPIQQPPDVWLGGAAPAELRRVGRLADGWLPSFCDPDTAAEGRVAVEDAAAAAGRAIDVEHFGALIIYTRESTLPARLAQIVAARRPDLDPTSVIPAGLPALRAQIEAFVARGFSKLVVVPVGEPASWSDELGQLADAVLDLQN